MSTKSVKDLLLKYFKIRDLIYRAESISLPSFMGLDEKLALPAIESMMNQASTLGLRSAHFKKLLESSLLAKKHDGTPIEKLNNYIKARCKPILNEIKKTPKSVDKALDALRATVEADTDYLSDAIYEVLK